MSHVLFEALEKDGKVGIATVGEVEFIQELRCPIPRSLLLPALLDPFVEGEVLLEEGQVLLFPIGYLFEYPLHFQLVHFLLGFALRQFPLPQLVHHFRFARLSIFLLVFVVPKELHFDFSQLVLLGLFLDSAHPNIF